MAIIISSHFKDEIEALLSEEPEKWVLHLWLMKGCVCVRERERDSGLRNGMALGGKLCVCERERVWVKD